MEQSGLIRVKRWALLRRGCDLLLPISTAEVSPPLLASRPEDSLELERNSAIFDGHGDRSATATRMNLDLANMSTALKARDRSLAA